MPLAEFVCEQCGAKIEKLITKMYDTAEEAAEDAPQCSKCEITTVWNECAQCSFKINFAPFH